MQELTRAERAQVSNLQPLTSPSWKARGRGGSTLTPVTIPAAQACTVLLLPFQCQVPHILASLDLSAWTSTEGWVSPALLSPTQAAVDLLKMVMDPHPHSLRPVYNY